MNLCSNTPGNNLNVECSNNPALEKSVAIAATAIEAAQQIKEHAEQIRSVTPTYKRRNIFLKSYNRRPRTKRKLALLRVQMMLESLFAAQKLYRISTQPIKKFEPGAANV